MRRRLLYLIFSVLLAFKNEAQQDSTVFTVDSRMNDGVYLTYMDFRTNHSIAREQIQSHIDKEQLNFLEKTLQQEKFSFKQNDNLYTVDPKRIWGFFQNNTLYVNHDGEFYRVPVFGSVSYLVAMVLVRSAGLYSPGFGYGMGMGPTYTKEMREFIMNFYDGQMTELTMDKAEALLSRDKTLYEEFKNLSNRKRKDQLYRFIRRYNELHPVYFLK